MRDKDRLIRAFGKLNMHVTDGIVRESVSSGGSKPAIPSRHAVVLLCGSDISLTTAFEGLRKMAEENWQFTAVLSKSAESLLSIDSIKSGFSPKQILKESDCIDVKRVIDTMDALILPNMTQNTLAKLSVGIQDELTALITWQALVSNKPVAINTDSVFKGWFDIESNRAMKRVMQNHVAVLKSYGAKLADKHDYLEILCGSTNGPKVGSMQRAQIGTKSDAKSGAQKPIQNRIQKNVQYQRQSLKQSLSITDIADKKLLTEKDIKALEGVTEIKIGKGQILTPLGRDAAISRGIRIIYQRQ
jgi:hypothetical protein